MAVKRHHSTLIFLLIMAGGVMLSFAKSKSERTFEVKQTKDEKALIVSFDFSDIFNKKSRKKLSNGLPTVVLLRLYLHAEGKKKPISMKLRKCKVIYDVWEEHYITTIETEGKKKTKKLESKEKTIKLCSSVKKMYYSPGNLKGGVYRFAAVVDLNPLSKEVLEAMRSWLKRPLSDTGHLNPADSFFGSFITIFVNEKIEPSEKTIKFKSQKFKLAF